MTDESEHPIHADIAFEGLSSGAISGDRELGDVSVRNLVGGSLKPLHNSDVDPYGVINAGVADKCKKYAKAIADHEIDGCMALVVNAGGGMSKDLSKLIYRLARTSYRAPHASCAARARARAELRARFPRTRRVPLRVRRLLGGGEGQGTSRDGPRAGAGALYGIRGIQNGIAARASPAIARGGTPRATRGVMLGPA